MSQQSKLPIAAVILCLLVPVASTARVTCIRLTCNHIADTTDLKRFRQFHPWKDKTGNELALAIWKYLSDYETGLYHFNEILEGPDPFDEYATVRDPLKILNTYNMAYCGIFGPVTDGIFQGVGFTQGRSFGLVAWNHCATELWYDDAWHYFDVDVRGVLIRPDGVIASLDEAQTNRDLWINPAVTVTPFFPKDPDKARIFDIYKDSQMYYYYRWFEAGHTMDFYLRSGESFTRFWTPQDGRWNHLSRYAKTKWIRNLIEQAPRGPKPNHREFTRWNHGNGLFDYQPILTNVSTDFADGYYEVRNLRPGEDGLVFIQDGPAEVTFEVFTPYIIIPKVNDLDDPNDDCEASVVTLKGTRPVEVWVSLDHGLSWQKAGKIESSLDLTPIVKRTYGFLLKLKTSGQKGSTAIDFLNIKTWVQVAPTSLPALKKGKTTFRYETGDRYGRQTIPMLIKPNTANPDDLKKYALRMPEDYDPNRHTCRIRGELIVRLTAPPGMKISWFTIGGTFRTDQGEHAKDTDNRIAYAIGQNKAKMTSTQKKQGQDGLATDFKEIYRSNVPTWVNHWRYNWDEDVVLAKPAEEVFVKYTAHTGLNTLRACLHLLPERSSDKHIKITHTYHIDGQLKEVKKNLTGPATYTVECPAKPENVSIKLEVPHRQ